MWNVGDKIGGRYEVRDIKVGGMGIVYLCYHHEFKVPSTGTISTPHVYQSKGRGAYPPRV